MSWWSDLWNGAKEVFNTQRQEEPTREAPSSEPVDQPTWIERVFGSSRGEGEESLRDSLEEYQPESEESALAYIGWSPAANATPEQRRVAREEFEDTYGRLSDEQWADWRRRMGYA